MNEAVSLHPCGDGRESGTNIKEELAWTYRTLGLAWSHTCALATYSKQSALWLEIKGILICSGHRLSWPIVILYHFLKGNRTPSNNFFQ